MRTIIHENERGILTKNGRFVRVLGAGKWRTFGGSAIETLGVDRRSIAAVQSVPMSVLEKDAGFCAQALTVDVHDGEYVLHFTDGVFYELLTVPGRYFFWKDACEHAFRQTNVTSPEPDEAFPRAYFANIPSRLYSTVEVGQRERAALYFDGKFVRFLDPGVYYFWNRETLVTSVRYPACVVQREIPGQEILTADKVTLRINCVCDYEIADFERIAAEVDDYGKQLHTAVQLALREYVGRYRLDEILENKNALTEYLTETIAEKGKELFLNVHCAAVRDIILPGEIREIMNTVLIAEKRAQANVIARREEVASTRSLLNTARLMDENETLYKLKEWEYIERICEKVGSINVSGGDLPAQLVELLAGRREERKKK